MGREREEEVIQRLQADGKVSPTARRDILCSEHVQKGNLWARVYGRSETHTKEMVKIVLIREGPEETVG